MIHNSKIYNQKIQSEKWLHTKLWFAASTYDVFMYICTYTISANTPYSYMVNFYCIYIYIYVFKHARTCSLKWPSLFHPSRASAMCRLLWRWWRERNHFWPKSANDRWPTPTLKLLRQRWTFGICWRKMKHWTCSGLEGIIGILIYFNMISEDQQLWRFSHLAALASSPRNCDKLQKGCWSGCRLSES